MQIAECEIKVKPWSLTTLENDTNNSKYCKEKKSNQAAM